MVAEKEQIEWRLVQLEGDDRLPAAQSQVDEGEETLAEPEPELKEPDPDAFHLLIQPPQADPELLVIDDALSGAEVKIESAVNQGYWLHGPEFFPALCDAIDAPLANEYQGGEKPPRRLAPEQRSRLIGFARKSIEACQNKIDAALLAAQAHAGALALAQLNASQAQVLAAAMRYIREADSRRRARAWLETPTTAGGAQTFQFTQDAGLDLVKSLVTLWTAYRELAKEDSALADVMKKSGPEMQRVAAARWQYLRNRDRANTPRDTYHSKDYDIELLRSANTKHPELVAEAIDKFPEPAQVVAARARVMAKAGALTATLVDEGEKHPLLYRIWDPRLAQELYARFDRPDIGIADIKIFSPVFNFRYAVAEALRTTWHAANRLSERIAREPALVWRFPILIDTALQDMQLEIDSFTRMAAEHRLDQLAAEDERSNRFFMRASEVLTLAGLAVRLIPAPAVSVPAAAVLAAVDLVLSGIGLLINYFKETDTREGFRAFLVPGEAFAASDGSYLGVMIGAAFLLFGAAGLKRTSFLPPTRAESGLTGALIGYQEYSTLSTPERRP